MKRITHASVGILILCSMLFAPQFVFAQQKVQSGLIPCGNVTDAFGKVQDSEKCTFDDVVRLAQIVINFLLFQIAAPLAALLFAYAGFLMFTNNGNEGRVTQAKQIFWNVFIGFVVALAAWTLVTFILDFFMGPANNNNNNTVPIRLVQ